MGIARELARELRGIRKSRGPAAAEEFTRTVAPEAIRAAGGRFSLQESFVETFPDGHALLQELNPSKRVGPSTVLFEAASSGAAGAVAASDFSKITSQLVFNSFMEEYDDAQFLWPELVETRQTNLQKEIIPGVSQLGDESEIVGEGGEYPMIGLTEDYIDTPPTIKRGLRVPITKEAIFFDKTGLVLEQARNVGRTIGFSKEKRVLDVVLGIVNTYSRNGISNDTYQSSSPWANVKSSNALVDWTDVEAAELLFDAMTDPSTNEPISVQADALIVPSALRRTAMRILNATEVDFGEDRGGNTTAANTTRTKSPNPIGDMGLRVLSNAYVKQRTSSETTWFVGQPKRAFVYLENWGPTIDQAPNLSYLEFSRDIAVQFKISERGVAAVKSPLHMVKSTA